MTSQHHVAEYVVFYLLNSQKHVHLLVATHVADLKSNDGTILDGHCVPLSAMETSTISCSSLSYLSASFRSCLDELFDEDFLFLLPITFVAFEFQT